MQYQLRGMMAIGLVLTGCTLPKEPLEPPVPASPVTFAPAAVSGDVQGPPQLTIGIPFAQVPITVDPPIVIQPEEQETPKTRKLSKRQPSEQAESPLVSPGPRHGNIIQRYAWQHGKVFRVFTAVNKPTSIFLPPGESLAAPPVLSDPKAWESDGARQDGGEQAIEVILLRPISMQPPSTMTILLKSGKTIFVQLEVFEKTHMTAVTWDIPVTEPLAVAAARSLTVAGFTGMTVPLPVSRPSVGPSRPVPQVDMTRLHTAYEIQTTGPRPAWTPLSVYDDGIKTVIRFATSLQGIPAPVVFVKHANGHSGVVDYIPYELPEDPRQGSYYIVTGLWPQLELRGPEGHTVRILRQGLPVPPFQPQYER